MAIKQFRKIDLIQKYIISSVFIGPFIAFTTFGFTSSGGDYCDSVYWLPDGSFNPIRETEFARSMLYARTLSTIFIALGLALTFKLVLSFRSKSISAPEFVVKLLLTLFMIAGYCLIFLVLGYNNQSC